MNNVDKVIQVISIGLIVAGFLLNTSRFLKAIELCKECLFILKNRADIKDGKLSKSFFMIIYFTIWKACSLFGDYKRHKIRKKFYKFTMKMVRNLKDVS